MPTQLILISHAPIKATRSASFPTDEPFDPPVKALREAGAEIAKIGPFDEALAGPERRTMETAKALGLGLDFVPEPRLGDFHYGEWAGRSMSEVESEDPVRLAQWITEPAKSAPFGDSVITLLVRIETWLEGIAEIDGRILVVTHPSVLRAALVYALNAPPHSFWRIDIEPLSLLDLRGNGDNWTLRSLRRLPR